jgi:hypothetical protein
VAVEIIDDTNYSITPDTILFTDDNHTTITFLTARTGKAIFTSGGGVQGTSGSSGSAGTSGSAGSSGANGTSGSSGANGTSGSAGSSGANGTSGSSGAAGTSGSSGTSVLAQLQENTPIILVSALSDDGKYSGITESASAGAALAFGDLCYLAVADSKWELTDADASATSGPVKLGVCVSAANENAITSMLLWGKVRANANFPTLVVGAPVYISTDPGDIQTVAPSGTTNIVRIIGYGNTGDELFFCPSNDYIELV